MGAGSGGVSVCFLLMSALTCLRTAAWAPVKFGLSWSSNETYSTFEFIGIFSTTVTSADPKLTTPFLTCDRGLGRLGVLWSWS